MTDSTIILTYSTLIMPDSTLIMTDSILIITDSTIIMTYWPFNFCDLPDSKKVSHMLKIDETNLFHSKIPRIQDSRIPRFQINRGVFHCSFQFLYPSWFLKGITHVANRWNQFVPFQDSRIPRFQILRGDSIVPFNICDLPDSKKMSHVGWKTPPNGANRQTRTQTDIATLWLNQPSGTESVKMVVRCLCQGSVALGLGAVTADNFVKMEAFGRLSTPPLCQGRPMCHQSWRPSYHVTLVVVRSDLIAIYN